MKSGSIFTRVLVVVFLSFLVLFFATEDLLRSDRLEKELETVVDVFENQASIKEKTKEKEIEAQTLKEQEAANIFVHQASVAEKTEEKAEENELLKEQEAANIFVHQASVAEKTEEKAEEIKEEKEKIALVSRSTQSRTGIASWYGPGFHGRTTANGEVYNMYAMTAASTSLPFGTNVRVTFLETGKSVTVRINDRGPFERSGGRWVPHSTRIIDLSMAAAKEIGLKNHGIGKVRIEW